MGIYDDAVDESADQYKKRGCAVGRLLKGMERDDQTELLAALSSDHVTSTGLARALRKRLGSSAPSGYTINRHRREVCGCG